MKKRGIRFLLIFIILLNLSGAFVARAKVNYIYDELNRVKKVEYPDGSYIEYEYDKAGNIISEKKVKAKKDEEKNDSGSSSEKEQENPPEGIVNNTGANVTISDVPKMILDLFTNKTNQSKIEKPKKPKLTKVKASGKKVLVQWKKDKKSKGTYIYASKKKKKGFKRIKIVKGTKNKVKVKKKSYQYVKIRSYKLVGKKKVFSTYSKTVKIKK